MAHIMYFRIIKALQLDAIKPSDCSPIQIIVLFIVCLY